MYASCVILRRLYDLIDVHCTVLCDAILHDLDSIRPSSFQSLKFFHFEPFLK